MVQRYYYICVLGVCLLFPSYSFTESYSNRSFHFHTTVKIKLAFENKVRPCTTCARDTVPCSSFINPIVSFWYFFSSSSSSTAFISFSLYRFHFSSLAVVPSLMKFPLATTAFQAFNFFLDVAIITPL